LGTTFWRSCITYVMVVHSVWPRQQNSSFGICDKPIMDDGTEALARVPISLSHVCLASYVCDTSCTLQWYCSVFGGVEGLFGSCDVTDVKSCRGRYLRRKFAKRWWLLVRVNPRRQKTSRWQWSSTEHSRQRSTYHRYSAPDSFLPRDAMQARPIPSYGVRPSVRHVRVICRNE